MNQPRGSINKKNIIKKAVLLSMRGALLMPISSGAEEVYSLPEMVVTAEKMPVESKKEPQAVQVVDQKEIESLGAVNATQALELVTGINLSSGKAGSTASMGGTQVMLRGMNTNQVLILVDGRRMADEDTSQTKNAYLLSRIPLSTIDKIEVVRGPSGAMYGSDGMGGVINIITKKQEYGVLQARRSQTRKKRCSASTRGRRSGARTSAIRLGNSAAGIPPSITARQRCALFPTGTRGRMNAAS